MGVIISIFSPNTWRCVAPFEDGGHKNSIYKNISEKWVTNLLFMFEPGHYTNSTYPDRDLGPTIEPISYKNWLESIGG